MSISSRFSGFTMAILLAVFPFTFASALAQTYKPKGDTAMFPGKRLIILIPYSPGGAADIMARVMMRFLPRHVPGEPTVIIQNMPGGGGIVGQNWVYNVAPKDGTVMGQFSTIFTDAIFSPDRVKFDPARFKWLGGVRETAVAFAHKGLASKGAEDLTFAGKKIFLGSTSVQSPRAMFSRLFLRLLGVDYKFITGYGSSGDMRAAMERGEINFTNDSLSGYYSSVVPMIEQGLAVPIAQEGTFEGGKVVRERRLPNVPTYSEVAVRLKGEAVREKPEFRALTLLLATRSIQRGWAYAEGVPGHVLDTMIRSFDRFLNDPEMHAAYEKAIGFKPVILSGREAQEIASSVVVIFKKDPEAVEVLKKLAQSGG